LPRGAVAGQQRLTTEAGVTLRDRLFWEEKAREIGWHFDKFGRLDTGNTKPRLLDLFCCAGGASEGYHRAGFDVVGVDIEPQPHYPFEFHQADALTYPLDGFDAVAASPPCQKHTLCQRIQKNEHPELIAPIRKRLRAAGIPYIIENVVGAPLIDPIELCGAMFGLRTYRHRLFECSFPILAPTHPKHTAPVRKMGRPVRDGEFMHVVGNFSGVALARKAMGIDWMVRDELREAIPPAYTEFIGRAAIEYLSAIRQAAE
jgi:DNA (cytosine-5)-methyltransferase 1